MLLFIDSKGDFLNVKKKYCLTFDDVFVLNLKLSLKVK